MSTGLSRVWILACLASAVSACQVGPASSVTKSDDLGRYNDELDRELQRVNHRFGAICPSRPLYVFVGSSERVALDDAAEPAAAFGREVDRAYAELQASLATRPACLDAHKVESLALLGIIDGDGQDDSRIVTTKFGWDDSSWSVESTVEWLWQGTATLDTEPFELNVAADLSKIIWEFAGQEPYDQIVYLVKAHGGRLALGGPDLEPALLFDTHGPEGRLASSLYAPLAPPAKADQSSPATADVDEGNPTSNIDEGDRTSGKGLAFSTLVNPVAAPGTADSPRFLGQAATYDDLSTKTVGTHRLSLPLGTTHPNLLILDSCYGSVTAARAFRGDAKLAILYNPNPMYTEFLEYKAMGSTELLTLPKFLFDLAATGPASDDQRRLLDRMLSGSATTDRDDDASNGQSSDELEESRYKELHIWSNGSAR